MTDFYLMVIVGRLPSNKSCPSRVSPSVLRPLATHLLPVHQYHINTAPSLKQLQTELIFLSKMGQVDKALKIVHTAKELDYPLHSNVICQLLNFAAKWNNQAVFSMTLDLISDNNQFVYDEQVYTTIIRGLLIFYGFTDAMKVYSEMISKRFIPRRNLLCQLFGDCLKRNDAENSCFFFDILLGRSVLPPVDQLMEFITLCLDEGLHDYVMKLLEYYSLLNIPLEEELVHQLKWYFEACNKKYVYS